MRGDVVYAIGYMGEIQCLAYALPCLHLHADVLLCLSKRSFNHLLLADNNMLLTCSVHQAQQLLDVLVAWCKKWHLEVNVYKTVAMVFWQPHSAQPGCTVSGMNAFFLAHVTASYN